MLDQAPYAAYELVVGLEVHIQVDTASKAFCGDATAFGAAPNTQVGPVSLALPGSLPRPNRRHLDHALRLGLALGCDIARECRFDRKHYFYPDLPKGYQISQDAQPVCTGGSLDVLVEGQRRRIALTRIHMEEDAGKLLHGEGSPHSLVDLNRAGVALLELVTEPVLRSPAEAQAFIAELRRLVRFLGISDGNMEEGSLRCDCNVSVRRRGEKALGTRCEIKNVNSMRHARRAIEYEAMRQINILEKGGHIVQETRSFDAQGGHTETLLRGKEDAPDYRYLPEPDLPPLPIGEAELAAARAAMPPTPWALEQRLAEDYGLPAYDVGVLCSEPALCGFFLQLAEHTPHRAAAAKLIINCLLAQERALAALPLSFGALADFIAVIEEGHVSQALAYQKLFPALLAQPDAAPAALAGALGLLQEKGRAWLLPIADALLAEFPDKVAAYRKGKRGLLGFFMGELMRRTENRAEPQAASALLRERLEG